MAVFCGCFGSKEEGRCTKRNVILRVHSVMYKSPAWETTDFYKPGELKHLSNPRKRNQPRFRKYRRENMEKTKKPPPWFGKMWKNLPEKVKVL
jgi:hypothetical protein